METPSLSVLQLELDDLKDSMSSVQSEVARCLTSLNSQNSKVCDAVSRLETVTAIVKAINMVKVKDTPTNSETTSPNLCSTKMSVPGSVTSCQGTTSVKMSVNKVKEMCRRQGWKLEGHYSTRAGKGDCPAVHFYELIVKKIKKDEVVRGVGGTKHDAVKLAFKSMELIVKEADNEEVKSEEIENRNIMKGSSDNLVNFVEDPFLPSKLFASSEDFLPGPPVYHAQDCEDHYTSIKSCPKRAASGTDLDKRELTVSYASGGDIVLKGLTVSSEDARALIGPWGSTIKKLQKSTGVRIFVLGVPGDKEQPVELKGKAHKVRLALEMIQEIIGAVEIPGASFEMLSSYL